MKSAHLAQIRVTLSISWGGRNKLRLPAIAYSSLWDEDEMKTEPLNTGVETWATFDY